MTHCIEPFIHDLVWRWLEQMDRYEVVRSEVGIGSGINSGRIDLVGKTVDDEYHGFEIKNTAKAFEQLNRYVQSGSLDRIYHCSRVGPEINSSLEDSSANQRAGMTLIDIRTQLSNGIATGQYSESEVIDAIRECFGEKAWNGEIQGLGQVNSRIMDNSEKTVKSLFVSNLGIPTADFDPEETYIDLDTATQLLRNYVRVPDKVGVVFVPVPLNDVQIDENGKFPPKEDWRAELIEPVQDIFTTSNMGSIRILRESEALTRNSAPPLSNMNESWVQHHAWLGYGTIREAVLPCTTENSIRRIDVMRFEGAMTATDAYENQDESEVIGIEAKSGSAVSGASDIREQLRSYLDSGCLTQLYLAVPSNSQSGAETVLNVEEDDPISDVGLMTVDEFGELNAVKTAKKRPQRYDSYVKVKGEREYTRAIGYGRVKPLEETEPKSSCRIESS
jgi:hypothetical protein